jgi:DNA-binding beta-propeller fold protein YncE
MRNKELESRGYEVCHPFKQINMNRITFISSSRRIIINDVKCRLARFLAVSLFLIILVYPATHCTAQQRSLLALSKTEHILAIVDPVTLKIIARVPVGPDPHEVIASSDGKTAYVSNTGGGRSYEINVIDLVAQKRLSNIDTRPLAGPHGLMFAGGKLWFSAEGSKSVGRYDPATGKIDWSMGTGQDRTHMIYVANDEKIIYTTNVNAGTVSILADTQPAGVQPRREWMHTIISVAKGSEGFDITPDGQQLWTVSAEDGSIAIIDLATRKVSFTIDARALGANRLKFTPDGKRALISSLRTGDLCVFDLASHKELKRISIGHGGAGILIDTDGSRAFVGCTPDNYVAVIDLKTLEVITHIDIGGPDGLAWALRL